MLVKRRGGDTLNKKVFAIVLATAIASVFIGIFAIRNAQSPVGERPEIYGRYMFLVEIDGIVQAGFREVEGLNVTVDVWDYREGNEIATPRLEPGLVHYGPLVLKSSLTQSKELWNWMENTIHGTVERKNIQVVILDSKGMEVARYQLSGAWPSSWKLGKLYSQGIGPVIEELVIQYEGLDRE